MGGHKYYSPQEVKLRKSQSNRIKGKRKDIVPKPYSFYLERVYHTEIVNGIKVQYVDFKLRKKRKKENSPHERA